MSQVNSVQSVGAIDGSHLLALAIGAWVAPIGHWPYWREKPQRPKPHPTPILSLTFASSRDVGENGGREIAVVRQHGRWGVQLEMKLFRSPIWLVIALILVALALWARSQDDLPPNSVHDTQAPSSTK